MRVFSKTLALPGGFTRFFLLTYTDRALSFLLPLVVLSFFGQTPYNVVELVFSYASLLYIVLDAGFSSYLFFGYRNAPAKEEFVLSAKKNFRLLLFCYCFLFIVMGVVKTRTDGGASEFVFTGIRILYSMYLAFYTNIARLEDRPSGIYQLSVPVSLLSLVSLLAGALGGFGEPLILFFLPQGVFILGFCIRSVSDRSGWPDLRSFIIYLGNAVRFSWPIILNIVAMSYINNFAKIFSYNNLSAEATSQISLTLRLGLLIQLTHTAVASYYSKTLYMDGTPRFNFAVFRKYVLALSAAFMCVCLCLFVMRFVPWIEVSIPLNVTSLLYIVYIIQWCFIGYLEIYFGIFNINRSVLVYSLIGAGLYTLFLVISSEINLFKLALIMNISAAVNLTLIIFRLQKLELFKRPVNL